MAVSSRAHYGVLFYGKGVSGATHPILPPKTVYTLTLYRITRKCQSFVSPLVTLNVLHAAYHTRHDLRRACFVLSKKPTGCSTPRNGGSEPLLPCLLPPSAATPAASQLAPRPPGFPACKWTRERLVAKEPLRFCPHAGFPSCGTQLSTSLHGRLRSTVSSVGCVPPPLPRRSFSSKTRERASRPQEPAAAVCVHLESGNTPATGRPKPDNGWPPLAPERHRPDSARLR